MGIVVWTERVRQYRKFAANRHSAFHFKIVRRGFPIHASDLWSSSNGAANRGDEVKASTGNKICVFGVYGSYENTYISTLPAVGDIGNHRGNRSDLVRASCSACNSTKCNSDQSR